MLNGRILNEKEAGLLNPVALAFVGDAVYSLYVRERLSLSGCGRVGDLQRAAGGIVSAKTQSELLDKLIPLFTNVESEIFRRAKNAKKAAKSKSASSLEYNRSTGFEAVMGYLYLTGQEERIRELLSVMGEEDFAIPERKTPFKPGLL